MTPPDCGACAAAVSGPPASIDLGSIRVIDSVGDWLDMEKETDVTLRHRTDLGGIVARYRKLPARVSCSMNGGHPHETGVVITTFCGRTLALGLDCGLRDILGFKEVKKRIEDEENHARVVVSLAVAKREFPQNAAMACRLLYARGSLLHKLERYLPRVCSEMTRRLGQGSSGRVLKIAGEVKEVETTKAKRDTEGNVRLYTKKDFVDLGHTYELRGIELFGKRPDGYKLSEHSQKILEIGRLNTTTESSQAGKTMHAAYTALQKAEDWLRDTRQFLTTANIQACLLAVGYQGQARWAPEGLHVTWNEPAGFRRMLLSQPDLIRAKEAA